MFQIKTDIRQYNCETREKVEKLIRNWVIRPSDLIYNEDAGEWNPIGQHPSFDELFRELEDEESRVPDTVVTSERPSGDDEEGGEVTQITESPLEDEPQEADEDEAPQPPEPSEDVEGVIRDSDEITMMTDKTLDMMRMDGDEDADEESEEEEENTDVVDRDEVTEDEDTDVVDRDDVEGSPEEPTQLIDRDDVEGSPSEEESTNVVERDEVEDEKEETIVVDREATGEEEPDEDEASESDGGGRHGLPEDVFVTNEIPSQKAEDSVLDELGELGADDEDFDLDEGLSETSDEVTDEREAPEEDGERRAKWRIVMSEDEDDVDAEWDNVAEEMRDTDEFSQEEIEATVSEDRSAPQENLDFEDEDEKADADEVSEEAEETEEEAEETEEEEVEEPTEEDEEDLEEVAVEAVDEDEDDDDLDGLLDDAAELVGVNVRDPDADAGEGGRQPTETPVEQTATDPAFVSEGYKMDLPIDVGPSDEDLEVGVPKANVSEEVKAATFPYPKPKHPGRVVMRKFGLGEELADDDDLADDLPDAGDPDVDPHAETKPVEGGKKKKETKNALESNSAKPVRNPSASNGRASKANNSKPKDQSALIVIVLLGTFIIALMLAVYFLG